MPFIWTKDETSYQSRHSWKVVAQRTLPPWHTESNTSPIVRAIVSDGKSRFPFAPTHKEYTFTTPGSYGGGGFGGGGCGGDGGGDGGGWGAFKLDCTDSSNSTSEGQSDDTVELKE
eukprot:scaffold845_cov364-Prasinococcus_capsulatus_cf.AAC.9